MLIPSIHTLLNTLLDFSFFDYICGVSLGHEIPLKLWQLNCWIGLVITLFLRHKFTFFVPLINILTVRKRKIHHFFFLGLYFYPFVHLIDALDTYNIVLTCLEVPMCHPLLLQPATSGVTIAYVWLIAPQYHSFNRCLKSRQFFPFHST